MDTLAFLQWPAMLVTIAASWFVPSRFKSNRWIGFLLFLASNLLWTVWGLHTGATALVILQVCLALLNTRGLRRSSSVAEGKAESKT